MQTIYLLACSSTKANHSCEARHLYTSPLFRFSLSYAERQKPDHILILSALHGVVSLDQVLKPYDKKLTHADATAWGEGVLQTLARYGTDAHFVALAGQLYTQPLHKLPHLTEPLAGLGLGKRLQFLKRHT